MGDVFKEQIVKRKPTAKDMAIRVCLIVLVVLIFYVTLVLLGSLAVIITAAAGFGAAYLMSFLSVEYEYVFTNGELDIDAIYNRARRKRLFSSHVNEFEVMAHVEDKNHFGRVQEVRDYSSGVSGPDTYAFLANLKGKKVKIIFEPNEKMLKAIAGVLTRRKLHLRPGTVLIQ